VGLEVIENHVREVVDVDDHFPNTEGTQPGKSDFEEGAAGDFHQSLGASVSERAEARAEASREDHGFHGEAFISLRRNRNTNSSAAEAVQKRNGSCRTLRGSG
jgi:hypothetical protein